MPDHAHLGKCEADENPDGEQRHQHLGVAPGGDSSISVMIAMM
jgi:hypothetical protein